jgi:hypothetical protein
MGRAMLFMVTGSFIILGIIQMGVFGRQATMNQMNVQHVLLAQSRNVASSGLERAIAQLVSDPNWRTQPGTTHQFNFGDEFATVTVMDGMMAGVDLPGDIIEIRSTGNSNGTTSQAMARIRSISGLPTLNGAMGIFTENLDFNVAGSAFLISGNDANLDGTAGPMGALPGIAVNSQEAFDEIMASTSDSQKQRIQGDSGSEDLFDDLGIAAGNRPSLEFNEDMDPTELEDFILKAEANADFIYHDHTASGAESLGSPLNPQIIVVTGTLAVTNATGAGIIIIKEGGALDARGNFDRYEGLIIIQGRADLTRGNIHILGGMLFGGSNPTIEIDIDFRGNVNIQYSSQALNNVSSRRPETAGSGRHIVSIFD